MVLTNKQKLGLEIAVQRYRDGKPYTCISGYAGTGKSTLIKFIIAALELNPQEDVCYIAYTGKAASVLKQKGCPNAVTAHKLLYRAKLMPNGKYKYIPRSTFEGNYKVIVVDEVSMLPKEMWELLLTHHTYILATGDPGQLPPIDKDTDNEVLKSPHVFLDEIMRQAQDSEIIRLSMWIREGKPLSQFKALGEQVQIFTPNQVVSGMYDWADQIICATNNKRNEINNIVRSQRGFGPNPSIGDKVISLSNHWDDFSDSGEWALTNGSIGIIESYNHQYLYYPKWIYEGAVNYMETTMGLDDGDAFTGIPIDTQSIITGTPTLNGKTRYLIKKSNKDAIIPYEFAYAYAITCHKSQGSEWDKVLVFEERFPFDSEEHKRWLYTAATRASKKLVIIRK